MQLKHVLSTDVANALLWLVLWFYTDFYFDWELLSISKAKFLYTFPVWNNDQQLNFMKTCAIKLTGKLHIDITVTRILS